MKNLKKALLAVVLSFAMVVAALPVASMYTYAAVSAPFTADATISSFTDDGITYTDWYSNQITEDLYTIKVPATAETITLDFGSTECIAYQYADAAKTDYKGSCASSGDYASNGQVGETKAIVKKYDGAFPAYVFVQTPYDSNWSSTDLYAVKIEVMTNADYLEACRSIAKSKMVNKYGSEWYAMTLARDGQVVSPDYYDSVVEAVMKGRGHLETSSSNYTNNAKTMLALTAGGIDGCVVGPYSLAARLIDVDSVKAQGVNGAIWALIALNSSPNYQSATADKKLYDYILDQRNSDGLWDWGYGTDIDLTAMAVIALQPHQDSDKVKSAVDNAVAFFASAMKEDGTYESYGSSNSNTTASVILALTALGINPETDSRFTSAAGKNPVDGLKLFFNEKTGFGYTDNKSYNQMATEQGYEALVALDRLANGKKSLFDMSDTTLEERVTCRIYGSSRYNTAIEVAEYLKVGEGEKYGNIIVASGENYPDALTGSYLSYLYSAPILLVSSSTESTVKEYIEKHLNRTSGQVYILGGTGAVSAKFEKSIKATFGDDQVTRLAGKNRYETNLAILEEGLAEDDVDEIPLIVCTGTGYADSLSASSTTMPIMLVGDKLTAEQKALLKKYPLSEVKVIGGTGVVSDKVFKEVCDTLGIKMNKDDRLAGANRYETSVKVAECFCPGTSTVVLAYGQNYPDGLSGGAVAMLHEAPLILVSNNSYAAASKFCKENGVKNTITIGGPSLISDEVARAMIK